MNIAITRQSAMFSLRTELLERLKKLAAKNNSSLNNYVETILMDAAYNTPNEVTIAAMAEAQDDSTLTSVDMSSFDSFLKSLDIK